MWGWFLVFLVGFSLGVGTLFALEALGVYVLIRRLNRKIQVEQAKLSDDSSSSSKDLDPHQSLGFAYNKKGFVWILEPEKVPKNWLVEKAPKEQKKKKDFFEVNPVRQYAKIKDGSFILKSPDNSLTTISLKGCRIEAVSASSLPSRKWAKRFPIKVESKGSTIYHGSKLIYIYLETSWEKESWCKALRLASCEDNGRLNWFTKLNEDFHNYLTSLNTGYPSFLKPSVVFSAEPTDRLVKFDGSGSNSKVRVFLKKLARKASEHKGISLLGREERKANEKSRFINDSILSGSLSKGPSGAKLPINYEEDNTEMLSYSRSSSHSLVSLSSDVESDEKLNIDEGTLCLNLLISRLFFDARSNTSMKSSMQTRIQRTLSNMRIPSYIGEVKCTGINLGNLPPHIHAIRVLPTDMNEAWAWEMDVEYCGGIVLDIETRLEVCDLNFQKGAEDANSESISAGDVASDLLEGFEDFGNQLNLAQGNVDAQDQLNESIPTDGKNLNSGASTSAQSTTSRWKSMLNTIAKQVQQVPISLSIRVASLRGTLRWQIKPPPSDQLWFGFTSMPDIEFGLASAFGEHKITNGQVALFLMNKFKNSIRETMVLPNCESVCIPWMFADKNDWVARSAAPFIWLNQEATSDHGDEQEIFSPQPVEAKMKADSSKGSTSGNSESEHQRMTNTESSQQPISDSSDPSAIKLSMQSSNSFQDLTTPLLTNGESQETSQQSSGCASANHSPSRSLKLVGQPNHVSEEDDSKPRRVGTRARMLDLGKKMGEKFEEKKRHFETKGRNIVDKMRGT